MENNTPTMVLSAEFVARKESDQCSEPDIARAVYTAAVNGYHSRDKEVAELVKALNYCSDILDGLINRTPTGDERNQLCDNNIHIKTLLLKY